MNTQDGAGPIALLADPATTAQNIALSSIYEGLAQGIFEAASDDELLPRIRAYDNNRRFTFGRAQTSTMPVARFMGGFELEWLKQLHFEQPDRSFFPVAWSDPLYSDLPNILSFSLQELVRNGDYENDEGMVTLFIHRTLVRPGETYPGFFHHDLFPGPGQIGTVVWYPLVTYANIEGAELYAYSASQDVPLEILGEREPEFKFPPATYNDSALVMRYPHNFAHGVTPGINPREPRDIPAPSYRDFVEPAPECFVKDLVIITLSERSPVEQ